MTPIMHKVVKSFCIVFGLALCQPAFAGIELPYPSGVERLMREQTENATLRIPVSPWSQNSKIQHEKRSGTATITTLQMRATAITPQQVATPIRQAMLDADFKIVLDCFSTECGGFDYRINTPIQSPPKMYINLRNFVSITGINGSDKNRPGNRYTSRNDNDGPPTLFNICAKYRNHIRNCWYDIIGRVGF